MIKNNITNKVYIGSSINIKNRWRSHLSELRRNVHYNSYLQRSWNKYGENNFEFKVLEEVTEKDLLLEVERKYVSLYNSDERDSGYNQAKVSTDKTRFTHSEESRIKIGKASKERGVSKAALDRLHESQLGEKNNHAKLSEVDVRNIYAAIKRKKYTPNVLAFIYDISHNILHKIENRQLWKHLTLLTDWEITEDIELRFQERIANVKNKLNNVINEILILLINQKHDVLEIAELYDIAHTEIDNIHSLCKHSLVNELLVKKKDKNQIVKNDKRFIFMTVKGKYTNQIYTLKLNTYIYDKIKNTGIEWELDENKKEVVAKLSHKKELDYQLKLSQLITNSNRKVSKVYYLNKNCLDLSDGNLLIQYYTFSNAKHVRFRKDRNKYQAYITINKKFKNIGHFDKKEDAVYAVFSFYFDLENNKYFKDVTM